MGKRTVRFLRMNKMKIRDGCILRITHVTLFPMKMRSFTLKKMLKLGVLVKGVNTIVPSFLARVQRLENLNAMEKDRGLNLFVREVVSIRVIKPKIMFQRRRMH
ncbi:uncharacterized protein LOC113294169 [Papaver somniferum]|uniref:uncharacterized protein LOC113294169 n=1 Tax=Papaver somniferum TaxID=3469 RepID=UPI000E6F6F46|nr:uncharacterized protein LOC113294169 [Papaver somniferum]